MNRDRIAPPRELRVATIAIAATLLCLAAPAGAAVPTGYNPAGLPTASCFWTGPFTAANPNTNYGFPGTRITYWGARFSTPEGARLILRGRYAHARYQSLNAYTGNGQASSSLSDVDTKPDPGSVNPFLAGHRRTARKRSYTVRVLGIPLPAHPARNTLYAERDPAGDLYQDILYRVYVADRGRGRSVGVGLPAPELRLAGGGVLRGRALCGAINANHMYASQTLPQSIQDSLVNWPGKDPTTNPALNPIFFEKFFNLGYTLAAFKTDPELAATDATPAGTNYDNRDARYMVGHFSLHYGRVLALRGRVPGTPRTHGGARVMGAGQLRYWDMCVIESLVTTRTFRCLYDEQLPLRRGRRYLIAVSKRGERPRNARRECGVAWLEADPAGDGAGRPEQGALLTRNVLPSRRFHRSSFDVETPNTAAGIMGPFYPRGTYMTVPEFEARGCPFRTGG